jgi:hypothetical protein
MKKIIFMILVSFVVVTLFANEYQQPKQIPLAIENKGEIKLSSVPQVREQDPPPNYSFILNGASQPTTFMNNSFYDYMPYSYNGHNIRLQPEISTPFGYPAGGIYITHHLSETDAINTDRRAYYSYLNADGTLNVSTAVNTYGTYREGFTSVAIDPVTGDPFVVWHAVVEDDGTYDSHITYDSFHITGAAGFWRQPWIMFDNPETSEPFTGFGDDEFIWPIVMVGDSPTEGYRRVHAYANNYPAAGAPANYNSLYGYADFNETHILMSSTFDWNYTTFPLMDHLNYDDIDRVNKDMIVKDNLVAFFGNYGDTLFVLLSEDCGETFTWHKQHWKVPVENPLNQDGTYYWVNDTDTTQAAEMFFALSNDGSHYNGVITQNNSKILWMSGVNINSQENMDAEPAQYYPAYFYPKIFSYDMETEEFQLYDMVLQGLDPADDQPAIPWDLDENGEVDEYYTDGDVYVPLAMATWFYNTDQGYQDGFFHESNFKMVANENWIVAGWHDATKLRWAYWGEDGYDGWVKQPEMVFSISDDYGETWSDPLYINANPNDNTVDPTNNYENHFAPELDGMLPVNISFGDKLEIISNEPGNYHAQLHFAFFDDNDYGSAAGQTEGAGETNGGSLRYASIDLEFQNEWIGAGTNDNTVFPNVAVIGQNYPNPFNPETTIKYQVKMDADINLEVFNIKGQKVKTLVDEFMPIGNYEATWNGTDDNGQSVSSGVYFYKMRSGKFTSTKKMVLMK